ncbi:hypothetical protein ODJ79_27705 [Actinoplanes sp. KI2]|uniref:hypothetical protein n=1 Tax=Actinoplanes sp. KI2 TaxID=2983315 RepID=UPI0021D5D06B|nr:hypothetical protein [Actinoplanes sp. KI2]MCU7727521.1 hypothetical protein [Actinoplanes sp. KI2]
MRRLIPILVLPALLAAVAACGDGGRRAAATAAAVAMLRAVADHDGEQACALLAPQTAKAVAQEQEATCADGVLKENLPAPGAEQDTQVYGQWAKVRLDHDTIFLATFPGGWRVVAAGCRPQEQDRPYDCTVSGR